ncbi:MAG: cytochrome C, partial [Syntrophaceae bacterium]|nr:cytochrome C [Syntrophaceae bacterium]
MKPVLFRSVSILFGGLLFFSTAYAQVCVECHKKVTPGIVNDWQLSKHSKNKIDCTVCHGSDHKSSKDVTQAKIPTPDTCATCHNQRVKEFKAGKHAHAWTAMKAMPTAHWQPMSLMEGMKGCGGCHKIGIKTEAEIKELKKSGAGFGVASCDACHTRHTFSVQEA